MLVGEIPAFCILHIWTFELGIFCHTSHSFIPQGGKKPRLSSGYYKAECINMHERSLLPQDDT